MRFWYRLRWAAPVRELRAADRVGPERHTPCVGQAGGGQVPAAHPPLTRHRCRRPQIRASIKGLFPDRDCFTLVSRPSPHLCAPGTVLHWHSWGGAHAHASFSATRCPTQHRNHLAAHSRAAPQVRPATEEELLRHLDETDPSLLRPQFVEVHCRGRRRRIRPPGSNRHAMG